MADQNPDQAANAGASLDLTRVSKIFFRFSNEEFSKQYPNNDATARFAHYTSVEAAKSIIENKQLWLRNALCMSDYRELNYGDRLIQTALGENENERFQNLVAALDACHPGVANSALGFFGQHLQGTLQHTYIASLSSHVSPDEDYHGRLSMWRGFGGESCRVALVFNVPHPSLFSPQAHVFFSPVAYFNQARVAKEIDLVIDAIKAEQEFLTKQVKPNELFGVVFMMLLSAVASLKHEGFQEEREWRVIHASKTLPSQIPELLKTELRVIHGALQRIFILPLDREKAPVMERLDFSQVLERIIIGPTQYPITQRDAFVELLAEKGVENPEAKVVYSDIPLRSRS